MFKNYDDLPNTGVLEVITAKSVPLRPVFFNGIFYEGLVSCYLARQTDGGDHHKKGEAAVIFFRKLSKCNNWNFENKYLILGKHKFVAPAQIHERQLCLPTKHFLLVIL